jgi:RNA polymerase sigma factor (sigma-70 family)
VRFATYAWPGVAARVRNAAAVPAGAMVEVPMRVRRASWRLRELRERVREERGEAPTREEEEAEVGAVRGVSLRLVKEAAPHLRSSLILDAPLRGGGAKGSGAGGGGGGNGHEATMEDVLECKELRPEEVVEMGMIREQVTAALRDHLAPRTAGIVAAKFGLYGKPPVSTTELAEALGISPPRVHQILQSGLAKLRKLAPGLAGYLKFLA